MSQNIPKKDEIVSEQVETPQQHNNVPKQVEIPQIKVETDSQTNNKTIPKEAENPQVKNKTIQKEAKNTKTKKKTIPKRNSRKWVRSCIIAFYINGSLSKNLRRHLCSELWMVYGGLHLVLVANR